MNYISLRDQVFNILNDRDANYKLPELEEVRPLGSGGFSDVFQMREASGKADIAMKSSMDNAFSDKVSYRSTKRDYTILSSLQGDCPYVPRLYYYPEDDGRDFNFFMEILPKSFADMFLKKGVTMSMDDEQIIAWQFINILRILKAKGIIHGDLKMDNFIYEAGMTTLIDFGLSPTQKERRAGKSIQVPAYRAPEVYFGLPYDESVDMWSLGCILYAAYTGHHLFDCPDDDDAYICANAFFYQTSAFIGSPPEHFFERTTNPEAKALFRKSGDAYHFQGFLPQVIYPRAVDHIERNIYYTAQQKGDSPEKANLLIDLIRRMLRFENRITPEEALYHPFVRDLLQIV